MDLLSLGQLLQSEGKAQQEVRRDLPGMLEAAIFLEGLLDHGDAGLLTPDLVVEVHRRVMQRSRTSYSRRPRATWMGRKWKFYGDPEDSPERMQRLVDAYNEEWSHGDPLRAVAELIHAFLEVHPFADGNGRTIKLIASYSLRARDPSVQALRFPKFDRWCEMLAHDDASLRLQAWLRDNNTVVRENKTV